MKVKTWIRRYFVSDWVEDEKIKNLLLDNGVSNFTTYKEQILNIDLQEIVDACSSGEDGEAGYRYCNRLYDLVHQKSIFVGEKDDLEFEIIEDGYPADIPYASCIFADVEGLHKWLLDEGAKESE